jgi:type IV pilus assembly protein PilQ
MRLIVESKGYGYVKDKNVVRIKTKESLEAEPVEARVISLNYAKADDVKRTVESLLTRQGRIQVDARSNALIVSDTPSNLTKIVPIIESMDTQTTQVMIEAKFVETTKNPRKDLGINWSQTLIDHKLTAGPFSLSKDLAGGPWVPSTALLDAGSATLLFSYMNNDSESELLANPRVVTVDNVKAKIAIAQQYPIPQFTYSESKGAFTISGFEYRDIGIVLDCTPHINKNDFVTLEVAPQAGSQSGVANFQGIDIPIIDNRTAVTTVLIKSGNTLAMGGLMRQDSNDKYTKVPLMGDIPGVGAFFRSKSLSKTKRELLIFLTPTIISPDGQTGLEKYVHGMPPTELYTNDKWMPEDNAKPNPRNLIPRRKPVKQNFTH